MWRICIEEYEMSTLVLKRFPVIVVLLAALILLVPIVTTIKPIPINSPFDDSNPKREFKEYKPDPNEPGPEGKFPRIPGLKGLPRIYILEEVGRKVIELYDDAGNLIARQTWTLSRIGDLIDDWTGPKEGWSYKTEVFLGQGNGLGEWLWKFGETTFYSDPTKVRIVLDMSKTSSGQTGWTTFKLPEIMNWIVGNLGNFEWIYQNPELKIWIYQFLN